MPIVINYTIHPSYMSKIVYTCDACGVELHEPLHRCRCGYNEHVYCPEHACDCEHSLGAIVDRYTRRIRDALQDPPALRDVLDALRHEADAAGHGQELREGFAPALYSQVTAFPRLTPAERAAAADIVDDAFDLPWAIVEP